MKMNTPTAIFLGLALIAVAIFFRQPSISEAQANGHLTMRGWAVGDDGASHLLSRNNQLFYCYKDKACVPAK
jgi:hypothetical protein